MEVAVLLGGPYRGNVQIINNQLELIGKYDTYLSCFEKYQQDWIASNWPIKQIFTTPTINFSETNWSRYRNDKPGQSGFWQFWNLKSVIENTPKSYDFYIKSRSDLHMHSALSLDIELLREDTLYTSAHSFHRDNFDPEVWVNDEFYIGSAKVMEVVGRYVTDFYKENSHPENAPTASNESNLRMYLKQNNVKVESFAGLKYTKDFNGATRPSGVIDQYQLEL